MYCIPATLRHDEMKPETRKHSDSLETSTKGGPFIETDLDICVVLSFTEPWKYDDNCMWKVTSRQITKTAIELWL